MTHHEVEKYRKAIRVLHWIHSGAFVLLFLTGLVLFIPPLAILAQGSWTRLIHRIGAFVFVVAPLIYLPLNWKSSWQGIKEAFTWGSEDLGWLQAAPRYYFLGDETAMPPQGHMNSGQKLWWLMVIVFGLVFVASGMVMWAFKTVAPAGLLQGMVILHDVAFIATGAMLVVHVYLSAIHPLMAGALGSMVRGKVSADYARSHHARWYATISSRVEEVKTPRQPELIAKS